MHVELAERDVIIPIPAARARKGKSNACGSLGLVTVTKLKPIFLKHYGF